MALAALLYGSVPFIAGGIAFVCLREIPAVVASLEFTMCPWIFHDFASFAASSRCVFGGRESCVHVLVLQEGVRIRVDTSVTCDFYFYSAVFSPSGPVLELHA